MWQARYKKLQADLFYLPQLFEVGVFLIPFQRKGDWDRARLGTMLRKTWFVRNRAVKGTQRIGSQIQYRQRTSASVSRECLRGMQPLGLAHLPNHMPHFTKIPQASLHASFRSRVFCFGPVPYATDSLPQLHIFLISGALQHTNFHLYPTNYIGITRLGGPDFGT